MKPALLPSANFNGSYTPYNEAHQITKNNENLQINISNKWQYLAINPVDIC